MWARLRELSDRGDLVGAKELLAVAEALPRRNRK